MDDETTYTIQELADRSGVSPRTIHFYISQGLLRGVGRQGPSSRYPESHLHTLLFIRELQTRARLSLEEIARVLAQVPPETIAAVARGEDRLSVADLRDVAVNLAAAAEEPEALPRSPGHAVLAGFLELPQDIGGEEAPYLPPPPDPRSSRSRARRFGWRRHREETPRETALQDSLLALSRLSGPAVPQDRQEPGTWVTIHVSDDLTLSARGMSPEELVILERIGHTIREILDRARREAGEKEKK